MGNESCEGRRAAEEKERGKATHIYQYHRKKSRKNINSSNTPRHTDEPLAAAAAAAVDSYPFWSPTPPPQVAAADTYAYAPAAGASSNPTPPSFLSGSIPGPVPSRPEPATDRNDRNHQGHHSFPHLTAAITQNKTPRAKVYPSVLVPPSFSSLPPPLGDDISLIELLASGEDEGDAERPGTAPPSGNNVKFVDMVETMDEGEKGKKEEEGQKNGNTRNNKNNEFVKMLMEEEGAVDEEELMKEVKEELLMREVDAYACLLRNPAADIDFRDLFGGSSSL